MTTATSYAIVKATFARECLSLRTNRFLYWHVALQLTAGLLTLISPPEAAARGASWWVLQVVIFAGSLSSLLLGLSSAHAETEEFPLLLTQPWSLHAWISGKVGALLAITLPSALLLVIPAGLLDAWSRELFATAAAAAAVMGTFALLGLALGFWVRDAVRGLIAVIALWLLMLAGTNLLLLLLAGSEWIQNNPDAWVLPLMINPLDAFRVTILFSVERAAFAGLDQGRLAGWWLDHAGIWLGALLLAWCTAAYSAAVLGSRRRPDA